MHSGSFFQNYTLHILSGTVIYYRTAFFNNPCLFSRNLFIRISQIFRMLETDRGNNADHRPLNHIGGIKPSSKSGFQDHIFHMALIKDIDSHQKQQFKKSRMRKRIRIFFEKIMDDIHDPLKRFQKQFIRHRFLIQLKTFINIHQMRRSKKSGLLSCSCQNRRQISTDGTFPVGPRHMNQLHAAFRMPHGFKYHAGILQRIFCRKPGCIINIINRFFVSHPILQAGPAVLLPGPSFVCIFQVFPSPLQF